jgi:hypothetical protein
MKINHIIVKSVSVLGLACVSWFCLVKARAADPPQTIPPVIEAGFASWSKGAAMETVFDLWQKGGLLEGDSKVSTQASYLRRVAGYAGAYRSHEVMQVKPISRTSEVLYLQLCFDRAAVYARFLLYRSDKDWVVQNMDFSTRPEALMPWLAFEGDRSAQ